VAHGRMRARSVLVRLRSMMPRGLRRGFIVGGLVLAGWLLLGNTGHAHAETGPGPGAGTDVIGSLSPAAMSASAALPAHVGPGRRLAAMVRSNAGLRGVVDSAERHTALIARGNTIEKVERIVALQAERKDVPTVAVARHRVAASPGKPAAIGHGAAHDRARHRGAEPSAAPARTAMDTGRCGHAHARTAPTAPAPPAGFPRQSGGQTGALPSAGSAQADGVAGYPARPAATPRRSLALASALGAVPPAVHAATDEPAISPD
jgi:hypothetical protein